MKTLKLLEIMWFSIAVIALLVGIYQLTTVSPASSVFYFIIAVLSGVFGYIRHKQRISAANKKYDDNERY